MCPARGSVGRLKTFALLSAPETISMPRPLSLLVALVTTLALALPAAAQSKPGSNEKVECTLCPASASDLVFPRHRVTAPATLRYFNVLHLLVQRLHKREKPAPANAAGRFVRQLRHDGASSPPPRALRLRCLPVTNALPSRLPRTA